MNIKNLDSNFGHVFYVDSTEDDNNNYLVVIESDATQTQLENYLTNKLKRGFVAYYDSTLLVPRQSFIIAERATGTSVALLTADNNTIVLDKYTVGDRTFWGVATSK